MIPAAVLLALAGPGAATCPAASADADVQAGTIEPHRALRQELGVALPDAPLRVLIYSEGGHLATTRISIVAVRDAGGRWRTDAVGRSRIWVKDAPPSDMPHLVRTLSAGDSRAVDVILADPDLWRETSSPAGHVGPPPLDHASRDVAVFTPRLRATGKYGKSRTSVVDPARPASHTGSAALTIACAAALSCRSRRPLGPCPLASPRQRRRRPGTTLRPDRSA